MNVHYLDLDDILTTSEMIHCTFEMPVKRLGYLNPSTDDLDIKKGTKLDLPFWLAQKLKNDEKRVVSVELPKQYRLSYRDAYRAEPQVVDLQGLGPNFYSLAVKMPLLDRVQSKDISSSLLMMYQARFKTIMDSAQNASYKEKGSCIAKFDTMERYLFEKGQESLEDMKKWETRELDKINKALVVKRHGKRKQAFD